MSGSSRSSRSQGAGPSGGEADGGATWGCTVCTFRNSNAQFKCGMCNTRKGTSTRPPKVPPPQVVVHQGAQRPCNDAPLHPSSSVSPGSHAPSPAPLAKPKERDRPANKNKRKFNRPVRLTNVDRSTAQHTAVTVGDVTVIITDYQPKDKTGVSTPDVSRLDGGRSSGPESSIDGDVNPSSESRDSDVLTVNGTRKHGSSSLARHHSDSLGSHGDAPTGPSPAKAARLAGPTKKGPARKGLGPRGQDDPSRGSSKGSNATNRQYSSDSSSSSAAPKGPWRVGASSPGDGDSSSGLGGAKWPSSTASPRLL